MANLLSGRNAIVTGGHTGIGAGIARALAREGANVLITYRRSEDSAHAVIESIRDMGCTGAMIRVDVTDKGQVAELGTYAAQVFSNGVDILVNNAGDLIKRVSLLDMDDEFFQQVMDVNLNSTFRVTKAILPHMKTGYGRIINMSSLAAFDGGGPGAAVYAASKAAVATLTRGMAKEFAARGITVNAVAPGYIANTGFHNTHTSPEAQAGMVSRTPLGRGGTPDDVAGAVVWLASEYAEWITGEIVQINGGAAFQ
jgi:3-oxoacyl-[acyl-carrier protein] reductase